MSTSRRCSRASASSSSVAPSDRKLSSRHSIEAEQRQLILMRSVVMIERNVRRWLSNKSRPRHTRMVVARDRLEYVSRSHSDARERAMRRARVTEHGWRAPLNKRYTPLGEPKLHLERKPEWVGRSMLANQRHTSTAILPGDSCSGSVVKYGFAYYTTDLWVRLSLRPVAFAWCMRILSGLARESPGFEPARHTCCIRPS